MKLSHKVKLSIMFGVEFIAIAIVILLVFFAGKKSYTVTFDLDGGTLLSGDLVQEVAQGKNATPPSTAKEGCYFHSWSASYKQVTRDIVIKAIWEYETTVGVTYTVDEGSNYCEIVGCFRDLRGDVYLGAYHDGKKVLGVKDGAFKDCADIEHIYMLDGVISIGDEAFAGCSSLKEIVLPRTLAKLGKDAFAGCTSLERVVLPDGLEVIGEGAFAGCSSLKEIVLPASLAVMGEGVFDTEELTVCVFLKEAERPEGWHAQWHNGMPTVKWEYAPLEDKQEQAE